MEIKRKANESNVEFCERVATEVRRMGRETQRSYQIANSAIETACPNCFEFLDCGDQVVVVSDGTSCINCETL